MTPQAVFVGVCTQDALALVSRYPSANERVVAEAMSNAGGGPAATAAVAAARQGIQAAFVGVVGADEEGERVLTGLRAEGVDTTGVTIDPTVSTGASVVIVDRPAATRAIANRQAPPPVLSEAALTLLESATWVHADHVGWAPLAAHVAAPRTWQFSLDAGYVIPGLDLRGVDLYVPTLESLQAQVAPERTSTDVKGLTDAARAAGALTVVATAGAEGSYGMDEAGVLHHVPAAPAEILSTLGAGDVFHGALVAALALGETLVEALAQANVVAALSCRRLDGRSGIPGRAEALSHLNDHPLT